MFHGRRARAYQKGLADGAMIQRSHDITVIRFTQRQPGIAYTELNTRCKSVTGHSSFHKDTTDDGPWPVRLVVGKSGAGRRIEFQTVNVGLN